MNMNLQAAVTVSEKRFN